MMGSQKLVMVNKSSPFINLGTPVFSPGVPATVSTAASNANPQIANTVTLASSATRAPTLLQHVPQGGHQKIKQSIPHLRPMLLRCAKSGLLCFVFAHYPIPFPLWVFMYLLSNPNLFCIEKIVKRFGGDSLLPGGRLRHPCFQAGGLELI